MKQTIKAMLILAVVLVLAGCTQKTEDNLLRQVTQAHNRENMPMAQEMMSIEVKEAVINNNVQEVDLKINASGYFPDKKKKKKDIPLKINVHSDNDAGCATDIVFPDFNIEKIIPAGSSDMIEIPPSKEGTFNFRCSMDIFRGKLIITK